MSMVLATAVALMAGGGLADAATRVGEGGMASSPQALSPEQRGELARQFVLKWVAYFQGA
ncbi:MAG: hypothetical protein KIS72_08230 [Luteimonas sp.]|nr:hypothetical protein [Luteimonas sp.]